MNCVQECISTDKIASDNKLGIITALAFYHFCGLGLAYLFIAGNKKEFCKSKEWKKPQIPRNVLMLTITCLTQTLSTWNKRVILGQIRKLFSIRSIFTDSLWLWLVQYSSRLSAHQSAPRLHDKLFFARKLGRFVLSQPGQIFHPKNLESLPVFLEIIVLESQEDLRMREFICWLLPEKEWKNLKF